MALRSENYQLICIPLTTMAIYNGRQVLLIITNRISNFGTRIIRTKKKKKRKLLGNVVERYKGSVEENQSKNIEKRKRKCRGYGFEMLGAINKTLPSQLPSFSYIFTPLFNTHSLSISFLHTFSLFLSLLAHISSLSPFFNTPPLLSLFHYIMYLTLFFYLYFFDILSPVSLLSIVSSFFLSLLFNSFQPPPPPLLLTPTHTLLSYTPFLTHSSLEHFSHSFTQYSLLSHSHSSLTHSFLSLTSHFTQSTLTLSIFKYAHSSSFSSISVIQ